MRGVARAVVERLGSGNVALISQDAYYRNNATLSLDDRQELNYDHPDAFDNELLVTHLHHLQLGKSIELPLYDFSTHARKSETIVKPMHDAFIEPSKRYADLIIPEGGENEIAIDLLTTRIRQFLHEFVPQ